MDNFENDIWGAITSVLNGNATPEEQRLFDIWLNEHEGNKIFFENLLKSHPEQKILTVDAKKRILAKVNQHIQPTYNIRQMRIWKYSAVASIALFIISAFYFIIFSGKEHSEQYLEAKTPYGVVSKIVLPDSSVVYLNSGSSLRYPVVFKGKTRNVLLKGEGYFDVTKDPKRMFVVQTDLMEVKVFGTRFDVKTFADENVFETTLIEGSVGVYKNLHSEEIIRLKPDQRLSYNSQTGKMSVNKVDAVLLSSWASGRYYFEKETLPVIAKKLERSFNIPIQINSRVLNDAKFSGLFDKNKTVFQILDIMKLHGRFDYKYKSDTIYIFK